MWRDARTGHLLPKGGESVCGVEEGNPLDPCSAYQERCRAWSWPAAAPQGPGRRRPPRSPGPGRRWHRTRGSVLRAPLFQPIRTSSVPSRTRTDPLDASVHRWPAVEQKCCRCPSPRGARMHRASRGCPDDPHVLSVAVVPVTVAAVGVVEVHVETGRVDILRMRAASPRRPRPRSTTVR